MNLKIILKIKLQNETKINEGQIKLNTLKKKISMCVCVCV